MSFMVLLWVPAAILLWRTIVSKQHWPVRIGGAIAAMLTVVGSATAPTLDPTDLSGFHLAGVRDWGALVAAAAGPAYLYLWSLKHRGRGRSKTVSLIGAIIGFVPIVASVAISLIYAE